MSYCQWHGRRERERESEPKLIIETLSEIASKKINRSLAKIASSGSETSATNNNSSSTTCLFSFLPNRTLSWANQDQLSPTQLPLSLSLSPHSLTFLHLHLNFVNRRIQSCRSLCLPPSSWQQDRSRRFLPTSTSEITFGKTHKHSRENRCDFYSNFQPTSAFCPPFFAPLFCRKRATITKFQPIPVRPQLRLGLNFDFDSYSYSNLDLDLNIGKFRIFCLSWSPYSVHLISVPFPVCFNLQLTDCLSSKLKRASRREASWYKELLD